MRSILRSLFAAVFVLTLAMVALADPSNGRGRTAICHATSSDKNPYSFLVVPPAGLARHLDDNGSSLAGHEKDFFPVDGDCNRSNDLGGDPGEPPPTATAEPITMLLFGAGLVGVGYASRRYLRKRSSENGTDA